MAKRNQSTKTGYSRQASDDADKRRELNRRRGAALQKFMARYDAVAILERQATDWDEGFGAGGATGPGSGGNAAAGGRTCAEALRGMVDHVVDPLTKQVKTTTIPDREGHLLAERCAAHAARIREWLREGERLDRELYALLPKDHPIAEMRARHEERSDGGAGTCERCGRVTAGIRENPLLGIEADRLKANLCFGGRGSCYDEWKNARYPDKAKFIDDWKNSHPTVGASETAGDAPQPPEDALPSGFTGQQSAQAAASPYCEHIPPHLTDPDAFRCPECHPAAS